MDNIIETNALTKTFGDVTAADQVSLHVRSGEIYGFLGLNGAGKTTVIRLLLNMITADHGTIKLFGQKPVQSSDLWNEVGYMVETPYSYPNLTVRENLSIVHKLRKLTDKSAIDEVIEVLRLNQYAHTQARHLSMGNGQRLGLAKALMHKPKLLILDEPINGLDPAGIVEIRDYIRHLVMEHQTTVFISSHILTEIARLATRIGIVHQGQLIKEINTKELDQQIIRKVKINTADNVLASETLKSHNFICANTDEGHLTLEDERALSHPEQLATLLVNNNIPPSMLVVEEEDLENYFLRMIQEQAR